RRGVIQFLRGSVQLAFGLVNISPGASRLFRFHTSHFRNRSNRPRDIEKSLDPINEFNTRSKFLPVTKHIRSRHPSFFRGFLSGSGTTSKRLGSPACGLAHAEILPDASPDFSETSRSATIPSKFRRHHQSFRRDRRVALVNPQILALTAD